MKNLKSDTKLGMALLRGIAAFAVLSLFKAPLVVAVVGVVIVTLVFD